MSTRKTTGKPPKSDAKSKPSSGKAKAKTATVPIPQTTTRASRVPAPPATKAPKFATATGAEAKKPDGGIPMKKQELLQKVSDHSGLRKNQIKEAVESTLHVLADALREGRELNLQPLGKVKQNRVRETPSAHIIVAKIRQRKDEAGGSNETVADAAE